MTCYGPGESETLKVENSSPPVLFFSVCFVFLVLSVESLQLFWINAQKCHRWLGEADAHDRSPHPLQHLDVI